MRYIENDRYGDSNDYLGSQKRLDNAQVNQVEQALTENQLGQLTLPIITTNQADYFLPEGQLIRIASTGAINISGFTGQRAGFVVVVNIGAADINLSSAVAPISQLQNQTIGGSIFGPPTLSGGSNNAVIFIYDFTSLRWRIVSNTHN